MNVQATTREHAGRAVPARQPLVRTIAVERATAVRVAAFALSFAALALFLWPTTRTWYLGDDAYHAFYGDATVLRGDSIREFIFHEIERGAEEIGRFAPLSFFVAVPAFWLTPSVFAYKLAVLLVTLVSVALATVLLRQLGLAWPYAVLLPVSLCALVQLRYWHDPLLGYGAGMQIVASLMLGTLIALAAAIRRRSVALHVVALALFAAGCLYWEGAALLMPAVIPVAWAIESSSLRVLVRRAAPFAAISATMVVVLVVLRAAAPAEGGMGHSALYKLDLSPGTLAPALAKQISGSLPFSYLVAITAKPDTDAGVLPPENRASPYGVAVAGRDVEPTLVSSPSTLLSNAVRDPLAIVVALLVGLTLAAALFSARSAVVPRRAPVAAAAVGGCLVVGAALAPVLSSRWQREIFYGVPYISVFLEYLGVAMIVIALVALALPALAGSRRTSTAVAVVFATAIATTALATFGLNSRVVEAFRGVEVAMAFNQDALAAGLLRNAGQRNELLLDESDAPLSPDFVSVAGGTPVPPTSSLEQFDRVFADCGETPGLCPRISLPVAYLTRFDKRGMPWAAVCAVDITVTWRELAAVCDGPIHVAIGGERFPDANCPPLLVDAVRVPTRPPRAELPLRLTEQGSAGTVTFCRASLPGPVYARSIVVGERRSSAEGPLAITRVHPEQARFREPFNVQPDGQAALAVTAVGVTPWTRIVVDGVDLLSRYIDEHTITALFPERLIARPARLQVRLRDRGVRSNAVTLEITAERQRRSGV